MKKIITITSVLIFSALFSLLSLAAFAQQPLSDEWLLTAIMKDSRNIKVVPGKRDVSIKFGNENTVSGSGGCNSFGGNYTPAKGGKIKFGPMHSTEMACVQEGVGAQERLYFNLLEKMTGYKVTEKTLVLSDNSGRNKLVFKRAVNTLSFKPTKEKILWIVDKAKVDCGEVTARKCYQVKKTDFAEWEILHQDIHGFQYVPGKYNLIRVNRVTEFSAQTEVLPFHYELIKVVSRTRLMPHVD